jgi:hypothetical protein
MEVRRGAALASIGDCAVCHTIEALAASRLRREKGTAQKFEPLEHLNKRHSYRL